MKATNYSKILGFLVLFFISSNLLSAQNCACNAGFDQTICVTQPLTLTATAGTPRFTPNAFLWTKIAGPAAIITTATATTTTVTGLAPGNYVFEFSNKCADGLFAKDYISVAVLPEPPTALAGVDVAICTPAAVPLNANSVTAPITGTWTASPAVGTFLPNANAPNATYTPPAGAAVYTLTWTTSNGICTKTDVMTVTVAAPTLPVNAGVDQTLSCNGSCATLNGSIPGITPPQSGFWTVVSGPNVPVFTNPNLRNTSVCGLVPGSYTLRWTVSGTCGNGQDDVVINVTNINTNPTNVAVTYNIYCATPTVTSQVLTGTALAAGETGVWVLTSGQAGVVISPNTTTATITTSNLTGTFPYTFTWKKTNIATGCNITVTHTINRNDGIQNLSNPADVELPCAATSGTFTISYTNTGTITSGITRTGVRVSGPAAVGSASYASSATIGAIRTDTWNITGMTTPGTYVYRIQYGNACGSTFRDIAVTTSGQPGLVNAGSDIVLPCNTLTANPTGSSVSSGAGYTLKWIQVSGPNTATLSGTNTLSLNMSLLIQGTYKMRLTVSGGNNCPTSYDDMIVIVTQQVPTIATTGPDATICAGSFQLMGNTVNPPELQGQWTVLPNFGVTFLPNGKVPNAVATGLAPNTVYTFTWQVSNSCGSVTSGIQTVTTTNVSGPPPSVTGIDVCVASTTTSLPLTGNAPGIYTPSWQALNAGSSITTTNTQNTTANFTGGVGTYRFVYSINSVGCASFPDTIVVTLANVITANAGTDINICTPIIPQTTTLTGSVIPFGSTAAWSQISGPNVPTINTPNNNTTAVSNLIAGIYEFEYRIFSGICTEVADIVNVRIGQEPTAANAGPDQALCSASTTPSITLAGSAVTVGTGYWQVVSSPAGSPTPVFSNQNLGTSTFSSITNGTYQLVWSSINGAVCPTSTDTVNITLTAKAQLPNDFSVCNATEITLTGNANTSGVFTQVGATPAGVTLTTNSPNTALASGLSANGNLPQAYTFRYSLPAVGACVASFDDLIVTINPTPTAANAGPDVEVCFNATTTTITGNIATVGTGSWIRESGPNTPTAGATNGNAIDTLLTNIIPGLYVYRYEVNTSTCSPSIDRMQIVKEVTANAGADQRFCNATTINLSGNAPIINTATWTQVSGPNTATVTTPNSPLSGVTGLIPGTYIFRWSITSPGACAANVDDVQIIIDPPVTGINAGTDQTFCEGSTVPFTIGTALQAGVTYTWTPAILLDNAALAQPTFNGVNNAGTYTYTVRGNIGACETFDNVVITVVPKPIVNIVRTVNCTSVFTATDAGVPSPSYTWNFGTSSTPNTATSAGPHTISYGSYTGSSNISLTINSSNGCSNSAIVPINLTCAPTPIKIDYFTASWQADAALLQWKNGAAISFSTFEVERSLDGITFTKIKSVAFIITQNFYSLLDNTISVNEATVYYRIKLVDNNGSYTYTNIIVLKRKNTNKIDVAPNPFIAFVDIGFTSDKKDNGVIQLFSTSGSLIKTTTINVNRGYQKYTLQNLQLLQSGMYIIKIITSSNVYSAKIVK
jgi:hypothetical protein